MYGAVYELCDDWVLKPCVARFFRFVEEANLNEFDALRFMT